MGSEAPENAMTVFTNKMLSEKIFNCNSCDNLLNFPIMIVENKGNVCGDCYTKNNWTGLHNQGLETILNELKIPCKFHATGCKDQIIFKDLNDHEITCNFRTEKCLLATTGCQWEGVQTDYPNHFTSDHPEHVLVSPNNRFNLQIDLDAFTAIIKLLESKKESCILLVEKQNNQLLYALTAIKGASNVENYRGTIKHVGRNTNYVETECSFTAFNQIKNDNFGAKIDLLALKQVTDAGDSVAIEVGIRNPNEVKELDEKMLQFFECPVCKGLMKPPIYQCKFGHSFCNDCRPKLEKCPTCRGIFGNTRNYSLEGLTAGIQYACVYQNLGCNETLTASYTGKHELVCTFKPYPCPLSDCPFTGNHSTIISHLNNLHPEQVIPASYYKTTVDFRLEQLMDFYNYCQKYYMIFDDNIFRLCFKRNSDYSFWAVEMLRKYDEDATYVYDIGIIDMRRQDRKLIRTDLCFNETNIEDLFKKCILFPNNILSSYASNGLFTYYCQIHKRQ